MRTDKPYDLSKFRKEQNKSLKIKDGFHDPITWIDTGNYALNKMISNNFYGGIPIGSVSGFAGESGCLPATAMVRIRAMTEAKTVTVGELRELFHRSDIEIEIDTPDGWQRIVSWWDKGLLPMVTITTKDSSTTCAANHLLQRSSGEWGLAADVATGDELLTEVGPSKIEAIYDHEYPMECFDFEVDHPNHRYWGDGISSHNSGKSYIVSGNVVRNALAQGVSVVLLDTENAVKRKWATALGVDVDHPNLIRWSKTTINQVAKTISDFMEGYVSDYSGAAREDMAPVLFVLDSLGNLETESGIEQFEKGDLKGDKGLFAKQSKMLLKNAIRAFDGYQVGMVFTNHTYKNQNTYSDHEDIITGGGGQIYISDILVSMNKSKLKEENNKKVVLGIESTIKCVKSRYAKPFEEVDVLIPYETGMDPYSGLFEMFQKKGILTKDGNRWYYKSTETGKEYKKFEKEITGRGQGTPDAEFLNMLMREYREDAIPVGVDETPEDADVE